ncbi:hypothetical protein PoB_000166300 [Plakobranchus ocellatus]|uniref:Uncharacterized protein n=1 Tax=Plakobranchus ocellatus TaxID=259542 RepID=A0AAV3XYT8_9GAST|nr:hypothetical protein PoB_000166300 [Plakobranchus ocellatus]
MNKGNREKTRSIRDVVYQKSGEDIMPRKVQEKALGEKTSGLSNQAGKRDQESGLSSHNYNKESGFLICMPD